LKGMPVAQATAESMRRADEGMPKLWTIHRALTLRRERPASFGESGAYTPLFAEGPKAEYVIAYVRGERIATIVPRWTVLLGGDWQGTSIELPGPRWTNRLTGALLKGGRLAVDEALREFPVALLVRESD
jgi:(1->4)-alpha-D-glucan 1-alpha-D-glucosylmutase